MSLPLPSVAPRRGDVLGADVIDGLLSASRSGAVQTSPLVGAVTRGPNGVEIELPRDQTIGSNRPRFSSDMEHDVIVGEPLSIQLEASNFAYLYGVADRTPLPDGLSLNSATGAITGAVQEPGDTTTVVWARNSRGARTAELLLHASMPDLPVVADQSAVGQVGEAFSYQIQTAGGTPRAFNGVAAYAISGLPEGLSLNPDTGLISGTPVASLEATALTMVVSNASGRAWLSLEERLPLFTLTVRPPSAPRITSPDNVGAFLDQPLTHYFATNVDAWLWEVDSGTPLPPGLALELSSDPWVTPAPPDMGQAPGMMDSVSPVFARLTGTPTDAGVYEVLVRAGGQGGWGPQQRLVISIGTVTPQIVAGDPPEWDLASGRLELELEINASNPTITAWETRNASSELSLVEQDPPVNHKRNLVGTILTSGTYSIEIRAANQFGWGEWKLITIITYDSRSPVITHDGTETAEALNTLDIAIVASNSPTAYGCTLVSGSAIVSVVGSTAKVTARVAGEHVVRLSATNAYGTATKDVTVTASAATFSLSPSSVSLACGVDVNGASSVEVSGIGPVEAYNGHNEPSGITIETDGSIDGTHNYDPSKSYPRAFSVGVDVLIHGEWFSVGTMTITMTKATLTLAPTTSHFNTSNPAYSAPSGGEVNFSLPNLYSTAVAVDSGSVAGNSSWAVARSGGPSGNKAWLSGAMSNQSSSGATLTITAVRVNISWSGLPVPEADSPPDYIFTITLVNAKGSGTCQVSCTHNDPRT